MLRSSSCIRFLKSSSSMGENKKRRPRCSAGDGRIKYCTTVVVSSVLAYGLYMRNGGTEYTIPPFFQALLTARAFRFFKSQLTAWAFRFFKVQQNGMDSPLWEVIDGRTIISLCRGFLRTAIICVPSIKVNREIAQNTKFFQTFKINLNILPSERFLYASSPNLDTTLCKISPL